MYILDVKTSKQLNEQQLTLFTDIINTINEAFPINRTVKIHFVNYRSRSSLIGRAVLSENKIFIYCNSWVYARGSNQHIGAVIAHEIGHFNHCFVEKDFFKCTDYERELYADAFAAAVLGKAWNDGYCSYYPGYKGYTTK